MFFVAAVMIGCAEDTIQNVSGSNNDPNTVRAVISVNSLDIPNGGLVSIGVGVTGVFDGSRSLNATSWYWTFKRNGILIDTSTMKTFTRTFSSAPDTIIVTMKVNGPGGADSVWFRLVVTNGQQSGNDIYLISSILLANGKRANAIYLPKWFLDAGSTASPQIYGYRGRPWAGVANPPGDTVSGGFILRDTSYDIGGDKINFSGFQGGPWGHKERSVNFQYLGGSDNLFWLDVRNGTLYGWGQTAPTAPGFVGDNNFMTGNLRLSFNALNVALHINVKSGNFAWNHTPQYQWATTGGYTTVNMSMVPSSGWGDGSVLMSSIGPDNKVKIRIPGVNITNSMWYIQAEDALVFVVIQPLYPGGQAEFVTVEEAKARGINTEL